LLVLFLLFLSCDAEITKISTASGIIPVQVSKIGSSIISGPVSHLYGVPKEGNRPFESVFQALIKLTTPAYAAEGNCTSNCNNQLSPAQYYPAMVGGFVTLIIATCLAIFGFSDFQTWGKAFIAGFGATATDGKGGAEFLNTRDNNFKYNFVRLIVSLFLILVTWLQTTNGISWGAMALLPFLYFFTFFGDLAATGRLHLNQFSMKSLLVPAAFIPFVLIDGVIAIALIAFILDMATKWGFSMGQTVENTWLLLISFIAQQLHGNTLKEGFVYSANTFFDNMGMTKIIKAVLVIVLAVGCVSQYFLLYHPYILSVKERNCALAWDANIGQDVCQVVNDPNNQAFWSSCTSICNQFSGEPLCVQLNAAIGNSTCAVTATKNVGKQIGTGVILVLLAYLVLGGLIPGNKFALSGILERPVPATEAETVEKTAPVVLEQHHHKSAHKKAHKAHKSHHSSSWD